MLLMACTTQCVEHTERLRGARACSLRHTATHCHEVRWNVCSCYLGIVIGAISLTAFTLLWRHVKVYQSRQYLRQVAFKPPDVPSKKWYGWELPWCDPPTEPITSHHTQHCNRQDARFVVT